MKHFLGLLLACLLMTIAEAATVTVTWSASTDAVGVVGYNVYRSTGGGASTKIGTSTTTTYTDTTAAAGTAYSYTVQAYDAKGNTSGFSIPATITTAAAPDTTAPTIPTNVVATEASVQPPTGSSIPFAALHTYFISPTGNDSNNGTSTTTAWATANHPIVCGDVVLVAPGSYTNNQFGNNGQNFRQPTGCPSTNGGIDGAGGIYFAALLCAGADLMACKVNSTVGYDAVRSDKGNWLVSGFWATQRPTDSGACFSSLGTTQGVNWHHIAFINNIASTCDLSGVTTGHTGQTLSGNDQTAVIGNAIYNGATSLGPYKVCGSGISVIPSPSSDTGTGTHIIVEQNFLWKNINSPDPADATNNGCNVSGGTHTHSDGNGIILDTWAFNPYPYQGVVRNNAIWQSGATGIQVFPQAACAATGNQDQARVYIWNNSSWNNAQDRYNGGSSDMWLHGTCPTSGGFYNLQNNIAQSMRLFSGDDPTPVCPQIWCQVHASNLECKFGVCNDTVMIDKNNWFWSAAAPTRIGIGPYNSYNTSYPWTSTTDTFSNPGLANPTALPLGAPDCTGYKLVTDCMLTKYNVYNSIKPTIAPTTAGYQPPGPCAADPLYPAYLKGVVVLLASGFANGATITQNGGLITKPCNL